MKRDGVLVVVSGFSGAGKGTLLKRLMEKYDDYVFSISMTTRAPRVGESDGREYFFRTKEVFEQTIQEDGFIEYASYCDNYYGTPKEYVESQLREGKNVLLDIEVQGAMNIRKKYPSALIIYVLPPSVKELRKRLEGRGTESKEVIDKRIRRAKEEAEFIDAYDYILINDDLDSCVEELHRVIMAAHNTPLNNMEFINNIKEELKDC